MTSLTDIKFIYIIFMYLVLLLFYLTTLPATERLLFHQSCQLPTLSCVRLGYLLLLQAPTSEKVARVS